MALHVGLTGSIGAGKSTVARRLASWGARVVDADSLVADAYRRPDVLDAVTERFGPDAVQEGRIKRDVLAAHVFADPQERRWLEGLIHPVVAELRSAARQAAERDGVRVVVHDVPLLFETGIDQQMNLNVLITAPPDVRAKRAWERSGMDRDAFDARDRAQMPDAEKREKADVVVINDAGLQELHEAVDQIWRERIAPYLD